jgi:hypothetical protein
MKVMYQFVAYFLTEGTVDPQKQPLLYNDHERSEYTRPVLRQQLGKYVSAAKWQFLNKPQ